MFEDAVKAIFIVCMSESLKPGSKAANSKKFVDSKIESFNYEETYNVTIDGQARGKTESYDDDNDELIQEEFNAYVKALEFSDEDIPKDSEMSKYIQSLYNKAMLLCNNEAHENFMHINSYHLPDFAPYLMNLFSQVKCFFLRTNLHFKVRNLR